MRFGMRDLLYAMTLASLYLAGCGLLNGATKASELAVVAALCVLVAIGGAAIAAVNAISSVGIVGEVTTRVYSPWSWPRHTAVACVCFLAVACLRVIGGPTYSVLSAYLLLSGIAVHLFLIVNSRTTFGERAVIAEGHFRTWSRCRFAIVSDRHGDWLAITTPWYRRNQRVRLPPERVEEVRAILTTRQPAVDPEESA